ncbi:MAG: NAD+ synthase [Candidatus Marinimicrobia bacterium]|nr:NAD+ synthase [Candidatus Neomarinimicrobiota bacterium]|tara:strand:+ start:15524 stop:17137 length:1614 start_codon:yes stop_codon:yes gene_type:complete
MQIALCQINPTVGDFTNNGDKVLSFYRRAVDSGADLVVFPELVLTGYPPQDLLLEHTFVQKNVVTLKNIASSVEEAPAVVGYVQPEEEKLFNSAALIQNGKVVGRYDKILLPTYDVFDEARYFTPGKKPVPFDIRIGGEKVSLGLEICEDLWDDEYDCHVTNELATSGANLIVNISSSPFSEGKSKDREMLISDRVSQTGVPFLYCNLVGGQDDLIFDGNSVAYSAKGKRIGGGRAFHEEVVLVDLESDREVAPLIQTREAELFNALTLGIRDYFWKTGHYKCVIGLSGGIDSALTACLAVEALGKENVLCIYMPSRFNSKHSQIDAEELADKLDVEYRVLPIGDLTSHYENIFDEQFNGLKKGITEENIQARIRGNLLMAFANKMGYLVISTGNKTEVALGYCTLYGDMSGGLAAISDLDKTDVYALSRWYNESCGLKIIPDSIFGKDPSAELSENQVDPFDYDLVSPLVKEIVENHRSKSELVSMGYDVDLVEDISRRVQRSEFKRRQAAPGLRVTTKAFGMGRRYPIVNRFEER